MKQPVITHNEFTIRGGTLNLYTHKTVSGTYRTGIYTHPLGMVFVVTEPRHCQITTATGGSYYYRTRTDTPTDRQISNFCRKLLKEINGQN